MLSALHILIVVVALALDWSRAVLSHAADPRPPPDRDPGGTAVAVVGRGIDYTRREVAHRLARDGEGQIIGFDFADNDAYPFAPYPQGDDDLAGVILEEGRTTRLVVVRTPAGRAAALAPALQLIAQTPARIALLVPQLGAPMDLANLVDAARRLPHLLLIVPARLVTGVTSASHGGLIVVAGSPSDRTAGFSAAADVALAREPEVSAAQDAGTVAGQTRLIDDLAAARLAALAARIVAAEPTLAGLALKDRIVGLAKPGPSGHPPLIADVGRLLLPK